MVTNTGNKPRRWVEIEPYVWKDVDSGEKLAAKVEDGKIDRWSFDTVSPFMMIDRVPGTRIRHGLRRPFRLARPAAARCPCPGPPERSPGSVQARAALEGSRLRNQRIWLGSQWLVLATIAGWLTFVSVGFSSLDLLGGRWIRC
jgi:hypothetical protein